MDQEITFEKLAAQYQDGIRTIYGGWRQFALEPKRIHVSPAVHAKLGDVARTVKAPAVGGIAAPAFHGLPVILNYAMTEWAVETKNGVILPYKIWKQLKSYAKILDDLLEDT